ncbi:MAG TPA: hypothetical protein VIK84_06430 [Haloplasmataceae bacterium]
MRKFLKAEIDLIYNQLQSEEEVLWRGKPHIFPSLSYITTLLLVLIINIILLSLRLIKINDLHTSYKDWYTISLIILLIGTLIYIILYADHHFKKMKDLFYVVTNNRLMIINSKKEKVIHEKLFSTIKVLRLNKSFLDSGSIIFDIDFSKAQVKEIGFSNIDNAEEVFNIIQKQLYHMRNKEE